MPWPYAFLTFVAISLITAGHLVAGGLTSVLTVFLLLRDLRRTPRQYLPAILAGFVLGAWLFTLRAPLLKQQDTVVGDGSGSVTSISRKSVIVTTDAGAKMRLTGLATATLPAKHSRIAYSCTAFGAPESTFLTFEKLSGVQTWCRVKSLRITEKPTGNLHAARARVLAFLQERFALLGDDSLIAAFLIGETQGLSQSELTAFRDMGLMHLFAVSGLNVALLFALLYLPFRYAGVPAVGASLGYAVATGFLLLLDFPVPLFRAWLFMTIGLLMRLADRRISPWTLLFLTALIVELLQPLSSFTISFLLSFGITAAILLFYAPLHFCFNGTGKIRELLAGHVALTLAAGLPAFVIGFFLFGSAQPLSLIYNLLLVPFSGAYLFAALIYLVFEPARWLLLALDQLYLHFAGFHTGFVMPYVPVAHRTAQFFSVLTVIVLLLTLLYLQRRHRLWSARRNLRLVLPLATFVLLAPFLMGRVAERAFYAVPDRVWSYKQGQLIAAGKQLFATAEAPQLCLPIRQQATESAVALYRGFTRIGNTCFAFAASMQPELWPSGALAECRELHLFQARKLGTGAAQWAEMFRLLGYPGTVKIRHYATWYSDRPLPCAKSESF